MCTKWHFGLYPINTDYKQLKAMREAGCIRRSPLNLCHDQHDRPDHANHRP